jgi:hypothetical protein
VPHGNEVLSPRQIVEAAFGLRHLEIVGDRHLDVRAERLSRWMLAVSGVRAGAPALSPTPWRPRSAGPCGPARRSGPVRTVSGRPPRRYIPTVTRACMCT